MGAEAVAGVGVGVGDGAARVGCGAGGATMAAVATGITGAVSCLQPASAKVEAAASARARVSDPDGLRAGDRPSAVRLVMGISSDDSIMFGSTARVASGVSVGHT